ncbi:MAG: RDD family protein [Flavobacteriaceae bacterium]|jgi:uncharacterized RDD family membrane protein YckC|nr:RDD family protein [Flavobacteriaceae bacterium]
MEREYFIIINGKQEGPYSFEALKQFAITPSTMIWYKELNNWTQASYLNEFSSLFMQQEFGNSFANQSFGQRVSIHYSEDKRYVTVNTATERIHYRYADFGERFLARLIDGFVIIIPSLFVPLVASWIYWALMQSSTKQATVGQSAMGIQLLDCNAEKITFGQATGRYFAGILSGMTLLIGYFMFFWTDKKQTLHDNLAQTIVVKEINREPINRR